MSKERKDGGRNKNSRKSNSATGEGLSPTGNQKERAQAKVQEMFASENEKSPSDTQMASTDNVERRKEVELKCPDEDDQNGEHSKLSAGEDEKNEVLKSDHQSLRTGENSRLDKASTSETEKTDKKETDHLKQLPLSGYVHATSPVKPSAKNYTYFNFKFQTANGFVDGVCFDRSLHNQVKQKDETQKGVRISNYTLKRSLHDSNEMVICLSKRRKIENMFKCPFDYKEPQRSFSKISIIKDVADYTLISVIGKARVTSKESEVNVQGCQVKKLDCNIGDDTGVIKVTLWDKNIPLVKEGQVYEFVDLRVRSFQNEKYLSTSFDTVITIAKSDTSKMTVVPELMNDQESISEVTVIINKIAGVQEIQRYAVCNSCRRKLSNLQSNLCVCDSCGLSQVKTAHDQTHFSVGVFIAGEHNTVLRVLQDQVESFVKLYNERAESYNAINVESATDSQIIEAFLSAQNLKITFNSKSKLVSSIVYN